MPSDFLYVDTNFPTDDGSKTLPQQVSDLRSYIYMVMEQLRYTLNNLDSTNFNQTGLQQIENEITEPISIQIEDTENGLSNKIAVTAEGLQGQITSVKSTADGNAANITTLQVTAEGLQTQVTSVKTTAEGAEAAASTAQQTADDISLTVTHITNGSGSSATVKAASLDICASSSGSSVTLNGDKINLNGTVNVNSDSGLIPAGTVNFGGAAKIYTSGGVDSYMTITCPGAVFFQNDGGIVLASGMYGSSAPDSSTPGAGLDGAIYFKI